MAKEAGPSHAFPARHVVRRYERYEAMEEQWNEWTILCIIGRHGAF